MNSVFYEIFSKQSILLELYKELHPEDTEVTENDLNSIQIMNGSVCDLGVIGRNRIMFFFEAQTSMILNAPLKMLQNLSQAYKIYLETKHLNPNHVFQIKVPSPEFYVLDPTGEMPKVITLSDVFGGDDSFLQVKVKVLSLDDVRELPNLCSYFYFVRSLDARYSIHKNAYQIISDCLMMVENDNVVNEFLLKKSEEMEDAVMTRYRMKGLLTSANEIAQNIALKDTISILKKLGIADGEIIIQMQECGKDLERVKEYLSK